jgi:hypothetical protein
MMLAGPATSIATSPISRGSDRECQTELHGLIPLRTLIKNLPTSRPGGSPHIASAIRWCTKGVRARDGSRIRLQAIKMPGGWLSRDAWMNEFFDALTADRVLAAGPSEQSLPRTSAQRRRAIARADRALDLAGI